MLYSTGADDDASVCQSEFVCSKTKPILHSVFSSIQNQACQRKTPFGTKTDHLVSTSWATHDENHLCWSRALSDINQPLCQGVCDYFAVSNANVPDRHIMFVSGHSSEQSLAHYVSRPSVTQLESVSISAFSLIYFFSEDIEGGKFDVV